MIKQVVVIFRVTAYNIVMTEKIDNVIPFPEGGDWFVWRDEKGVLHRWLKGRYAIIKNPDGTYRDEFIDPNLKWEDAILEFGEIEADVHGQSQVIEKRQINSRKDYEEFWKKLKELNSQKNK